MLVGAPGDAWNVTLWIVAPNCQVTTPPIPMRTLLGVNASPLVVLTLRFDGSVPVMIAATVAVRVTDPIVNDTLMFVVPALIPVTVPEPSTSATAAFADVNDGEPGLEMTAFCVS